MVEQGGAYPGLSVRPPDVAQSCGIRPGATQEEGRDSDSHTSTRALCTRSRGGGGPEPDQVHEYGGQVYDGVQPRHTGEGNEGGTLPTSYLM